METCLILFKNPYAVLMTSDSFFFFPLRLISAAEVSYASSLICPEPHTISENVTTLSWTGFFGNQEIKLILKQLFQSKQGWVNLTLHGFDECAPTGTEHFTLYYGILFL